jgi:hypothetical protein
MTGLLETGDSSLVRAMGLLYLRYTCPPADLYCVVRAYLQGAPIFVSNSRRVLLRHVCAYVMLLFVSFVCVVCLCRLFVSFVCVVCLLFAADEEMLSPCANPDVTMTVGAFCQMLLTDMQYYRASTAMRRRCFLAISG